MKDARHGQLVRVVDLDDEHGNPRLVGRVGRVGARMVTDHGASAKDPLLGIVFASSRPRARFRVARHFLFEHDAFWESELESA